MPADVPLSPPTWRNAVLRYILAIAATSTFLLACRTLNPHVGDNVTYIILLPVVAFVAWYCGVGPSILTIALALGGIVDWIPKSPQHTPTPSIAALAFLFASAVIVALGEARRRDNEKLRNAQGQLEDRVRERTGELDAANLTLRKLSARLLQSQDDERRRIARELHDSIGQTLAALSMNLAAVATDIERLTKTVNTVNDSAALVRELSQEVRTISHLLHPPLLDEAGLASALRWYVDGFAERSKIKVDLEIPAAFERLGGG